MDDETALPDLGDLELDDSTDDFWKLAKVCTRYVKGEKTLNFFIFFLLSKS